MPSPRKCIRYVFTLNNPSEEETRLISLLESKVEYLCYGKETGESGTPHLQGFVLWKQPLEFSSAKALLGSRVHLEPARSLFPAIQYCKKDGDVVEYGKEPVRKGKSAVYDFKGTLEAYIAGGTKRARDHDNESFVYYASKIVKFSGRKNVERGEVRAVWVYGEPGCGKSRWAYENYRQAYRKTPQTKWWDHYEGETEVVVDDMCPGGVSLANMLRWVDRYPCLVEEKGGSMPLEATTFVFTSNMTPRCVWVDEAQIHIDAFHRRCMVLRYDELNKWTI